MSVCVPRKFKFKFRPPGIKFVGTQPCPSTDTLSVTVVTLHRQSSVVVRETIWSPKRKIFTLWASPKNFTNPCLGSWKGISPPDPFPRWWYLALCGPGTHYKDSDAAELSPEPSQPQLSCGKDRPVWNAQSKHTELSTSA